MDDHQLSMQDMSYFLELCLAMTDVGAHDHLFCSALQVTTCYELLVSDFKNVGNGEGMVEDEEAQSQKLAVFELKAIALHYVAALGIYQSDLQLKHLKHFSVAEYAHSLLA